MSYWIVNFRGHGTFDLHVNFPEGAVNRDSIVFANICEIAHIPGVPGDTPWMGDAAMEIRNIVPQNTHSVVFKVEIAWGSDLDFRMFIEIN